jgi:hypothetical protein
VELLKVPLICSITEDLLVTGKSVAIFVNFRETIKAIQARLNRARVSVVQGGKDNQPDIEAFQNNETRVALCNIAAGGVGLSLHDMHGGHPREALISPSWSEKEFLQVVRRIHRAGGKTPSRQRILIAAGSIEEKVFRSLKTKIKNMNMMNEGTLTANSGCSNPVPPQNEMTESSSSAGVSSPLPPKQVDHAARAHARYSPSSLAYREMCPSWEPEDDEGKDNSASEEGTRCHEACETENFSGLTEEQVILVDTCLTYVNDLIQGFESRPLINLKEQKLKVLSQFGSVDRILISGRVGHVIDYKFGRRSVEDAEFNIQLQAYILGVFDKFKDVQVITGHLLMPRRDEVSTYTYTREHDYDRIKLRVATIIARAKAGKEFSPTLKGCEFCGKKGACPALGKLALKQSTEIAFGEKGTAEMIGVNLTDRDTLSRMLSVAAIMEKWAVAIRKEGLRLSLEEGMDIPGYTVTYKKSARSVTSAQGAWDLLKEDISVNDFLECVSTVSIEKLETAFAAKAQRGDKGRSKQALENKLRDAGLFKEQG